MGVVTKLLLLCIVYILNLILISFCGCGKIIICMVALAVRLYIGRRMNSDIVSACSFVHHHTELLW